MVIANGCGKRILDLPLEDPSFSKVQAVLVNRGRKGISFDAAAFHRDRSGDTNTPGARGFLGILGERGRRTP